MFLSLARTFPNNQSCSCTKASTGGSFIVSCKVRDLGLVHGIDLPLLTVGTRLHEQIPFAGLPEWLPQTLRLALCRPFQNRKTKTIQGKS